MADRAKLAALAVLAAAGAGAWVLARRPVAAPMAAPVPPPRPTTVLGATLTAAPGELFFPTLGDLSSGAATLPGDPYAATLTLFGSFGQAHLGLFDDIGAGLSALWYGETDVKTAPAPDMDLPRGIRNNNPGNIRLSATVWQGQTIGWDASFVTFESPEYGIRAMFKILDTYQRKYALITIRQMITRWAPPVENDTEAYIAYVSGKAGPGPDMPIDLAGEFGKRMVAAMIEMENGIQPYSVAEIERAVELARI